MPQVPPCEIYCHSLSDRSILGPELAATDAQTLTLFGLHMPARLFRGTAEEHAAAKDLALARTLESLNSVLAEPVQDVLLRDADGAYCLEARTPVELEAEVGLPGGNIFHRSLQWPWAETSAEVGHLGRRDGPPVDPPRRRRGPPRRRRQRHTGAQRGQVGPRGLSADA